MQRKSSHYTYLLLFLIRCLITIHVWYGYISFSSDTTSGKWGTLVESTIQKINYLPYVTTNDKDIFYQSFIFNGCIYPSFSWSNIQYRDELCSVKTTDYKSFTITPKTDIYRSDGQTFTLNDIYFTYNTLLKENYRNIWALDPYKNLTIIADEEANTIQVIFPKASIDNMIFFTNFILPAHLLANQNLETYITTFYKQPIGTNCARLQSDTRDSKSTIFDLDACADIPLKFYQVKQFEDQKIFDEYVVNNPEAIDIIIDEQTPTGYEANKVVLNRFATLFFNTERMPTSLRKQLWWYIATNIYNETVKEYIVEDHFLFDAFPDIQELDIGAFDTLSRLQPIIPSSPPKQKDIIKELPNTLIFNTDTTSFTYQLWSQITDKFSLQISFPVSYSKISISYNQWREYFPESYNPTTKSTYYNLNPVYRNIAPGNNNYTIKAYDGDIHVATYTFDVAYLNDTTAEETTNNNLQDTENQPITIIYFNDMVSNTLIESLKQLFHDQWISDYFVFRRFDEADTFAWKIQSQDYDIAIRSISMWLRKDISNLFLSELPNINPSLYTNPELATAINEYFLFSPASRPSVKTRIDELYADTLPLIIFWKELGNINIKESLSFPYPFRLYVLWRRKDFIKDIELFQHFSIDRERVFNIENFKQFLKQ